MDKMKFMELLYKKYLDILKIDNTFKFYTYVYQGDVVVTANNEYSDIFIYVRPFSDSEDYLKEAYKKLSDYETELFVEKICEKVNQNG